MRLLPLLAWLVLGAGVCPVTGAGAASQGGPGPAASLREALAQNQTALRTYKWIETTEIRLKGEVKKKEQKQCSYGADGKVQKVAMPGAAPPAAPPQASGGGGRKGGRVKEAIVENKVEDLKDYMEEVAALVHQYVPPDPQKIQAAQAAGNVSTPPAAKPGLTSLTIKNYLKSDDSLSVGFDSSAKKMRSYEVASYVEQPKDDAVTLTVTFADLADGTTYPQHVVLKVAAKQIQVDVTNSGHAKAGL